MSLRLGTTARRLDMSAIHSGVRVTCPLRPGLDVTILPAAMFNPRYRKAVQDFIEREIGANGNGLHRHRDPEFVATALVADMTITDAEGEAVEYTPEIGTALLSDDGHADVLEWIAHEAYEFGRFYTEQVEEDAKNS